MLFTLVIQNKLMFLLHLYYFLSPLPACVRLDRLRLLYVVFDKVFSEKVNFTLLVAELAFDKKLFAINGWVQIIMSGF